MMPSVRTIRVTVAVIVMIWIVVSMGVHFELLQTASQIEVFQLLVATVGLGVSFWGLWTACKDAMTTFRDEPRRILAVGHVRSQVLRIGSHVLLVYGGWASVTMPPPPPLVEPQQAIIVRMVMVGVTLLLSLDYALDRRDRFVFIHHPWFRHQKSDGVS